MCGVEHRKKLVRYKIEQVILMKIIGITGGIGAGKSTVCKEFSSYGAEIIDADEISRNVTRKNGEAYEETVKCFGNEILDCNGEIKRKELAKIVFSDKEELKKLNLITHKHIFRKINEKIENSKSDMIVLDVPLLFSDDFPIKCDLTVAVISDAEERIRRVKLRDGEKEEAIRARMANQLSDSVLLEKADLFIENNSVEEMKKQVKKIIGTVRDKN